LSDLARLVLIGLPGSGKTTFLAALWHVLEDRSGATSLKLERLSGDRTYLNQIANDWRACVQVERTKLEPEEMVVLHLNGDGLGAFDLAVPDLSGEAFEALLTDRRMLARHDELVQSATGVILFIHPDVQKGTQLMQALHMEAALHAAVQGSDDNDGNAGTVAPWSIEKMPTQVKLVELLQFLLDRAPRKVRAAVVVSAWDLVETLGTPGDYMSRTMPMLWQFLEANDDLLEYALFGVSAQGGDITDVKDKHALLDLDASKRIKVRWGDEVSHDITKPIAWLLGAK
jgi:energy-coupling factor transporter ATP-binding protein EcfA2